jgi:uncharacterized protein (TIGR00266 family)
MKTDLRYQPAFTTLFATLQPGERIIAEADAMASMTANTAIKTRMNGGFIGGLLRRFFGGESMFVNEFSSADGEAAEVVLTQACPGDMQCVELHGNELFLTKGSFIAMGEGVKLGLRWAGFRSWFAGEGLFRLKVSGNGQVWMGGYGSTFEREVDGTYVVDSSHLLAYEPTVRLRIGLAGGIFSGFFGGEGFVSKMEGQGKVYLQSRSLDGLTAWTNGHLF